MTTARNNGYRRLTNAALAPTIAGGISRTVPYLIPNFYSATVIAAIVVVLELVAIAFIQMDTPPFFAVAKVMLGGGLVLATGVLIGSS
jgi:hypothetical protein